MSRFVPLLAALAAMVVIAAPAPAQQARPGTAKRVQDVRPVAQYPDTLVDAPQYEAMLEKFGELYAAADFSAALVQAQKLEELVRTDFGASHPNYAVALVSVAHAHEARGRYAVSEGRYGEAEEDLKAALAMKEKVLNPTHAEIRTTLAQLALVYGRTGRQADLEAIV